MLSCTKYYRFMPINIEDFEVSYSGLVVWSRNDLLSNIKLAG